MEITLKVFATLREKYPNLQTIKIKDEAVVKDVLLMIGLSPKAVSIIMLNGIRVELDKTLSEGDILALFPPVGGG